MQVRNKAIPFKIQKSSNHAILIQVDQADYFYDRLHYHPEFQITAIVQGEGILYAGNSLTTFAKGALCFIGSNTPHLLKNSKIYYTNDSPKIESVSLFFDYHSFGKNFFDINELAEIKALLQASKRVIKIISSEKTAIFNKILALQHKKQEAVIIDFLEILSLIKKANKEYINSEQYTLTLNEDAGSRLNEVINYTFKHYKTDIMLEQVINIAHLSRSQFSKFFKLHTGKTYIQFLNEYRIENACILLSNSNDNVEQICYEVGFKNVSNFIRQFKKVKEMTPSEYRKSWALEL